LVSLFLFGITLSSQAAKAKKEQLLKRERSLANNLPTGKKRACFWRPVERFVMKYKNDIGQT
jgi:hypothetical protein